VALTDAGPVARWTIDLRACDDGAAFRYVVPGEANASRVPDEATSFRYPAGTTVWSHDLADHYEGRHARHDIADVMVGTWAAPPFVGKLPGSRGYAAITESAIAGYSGMALQSAGDRRFVARLGHDHPVSYPYRLRYQIADIERLAKPAAIAGTITTPWRLVMASPTLNGLVNADIVHNLAPPPDPVLFPDGVRTAWVRPGRAVWRYLDGGENTFEGIKQFSALAGQLGFEYQVVEGLWQRWTDAQVKDLVDFSRERGVGIIVWKDSRALADAASQRAFLDKCKELGVAGAKIDFFDHEAKEMIDRYQALLRGAAERHLLLDFHGANKPAGEARTWPNELTREGVYGLEHRTAPEWAEINTTLPFTRYLAGAGDYTPVIFGERRKETSWTHQIATAAIFTSPLLVYGANPQSLLDSPAVDLIKSLPGHWDETVVLPPSEIGELAAVARRSGDAWFIAILNGPTARSVSVDLGFLGAESCDALLARDVPGDPAAMRMERTTLSRTSKLTVDLRAAGGFLGRCSRGAK
jgi:alpha-glucosidase